MKVFPGNVGWSLFRACEELLKEAVDRGDEETQEILIPAMNVWTAATRRSDVSAKHADCARRRMAMALAWCVEHVADGGAP